MRKTLTKTTMFLAAGVLFAGYTMAQTSSTTSSQTPASGTTTPKSQSSTGATKSGTTATKPRTAPATALVLKTDKEKQSYAVGTNIGTGFSKQMKQAGAPPLDLNILARGFKDALTGTKLAMTDEEIKTTLTALSAEIKKEQEAKEQATKAEGEAFLAANKTKDGVVTLPSGLQYKILTAGTGPKPTATDTVVCNYTGTLIDGKEFDSSAKHGGPAKIPVGRVIKGWTEALQLMPVGSKWQLWVPPDLAYGTQSAGPDIGPNSTLIFEVELVSIEPKTETPAAGTTPPPATHAITPKTGTTAPATPAPATPAPTTPPSGKP
jgi:FKBP-type peptidyl-prolyl cis-trans isomerase